VADRNPTTFEEAIERINDLEEELESLDALLLLRERVESDDGSRHALEDVALDLDPRQSQG
jgi:hypothetical protein